MKRLILPIVISTLCSFSSAALRKPAVAGQFYPADKQELSRMVEVFLNAVPSAKLQKPIVAMISPHAGYIYSGQVAAFSYKLLEGQKIDTIILIGNSHNYRTSRSAVYPEGRFETPLGQIEIYNEIAAKLLKASNYFEKNTVPHEQEHSLEVQLPFLQKILKDFKIVPVLSGDFSLEQCKEAGEVIAAAVKASNKKVLIIASSDMSHYPSWANANMADGKALNSLKAMDPAALKATVNSLMSSGINNLACVFCAEESVYTTIYAAKKLGADKVEILKYSNSGDVAGDRSRVVGYCAAAFFKEGGIETKTPVVKKEQGPMKEFSVTSKNQKELLKIARQSIEHYIKTGRVLKVESQDAELTAPAAVFVTLTKKGNLRGCIGTTEPVAQLYKAVNQMAVAAAVEDYRFPPVTEKELTEIKIEISVLSPMQKAGADAVKQNVHGVMIKSGGRSGLFLLQVWEHFSTKEDFMDELCSQKAGLPRDAWKKQGTDIYIFTVFAFEE